IASGWQISDSARASHRRRAARVAESVYAADLKSAGPKRAVWVQVPSRAQWIVRGLPSSVSLFGLSSESDSPTLLTSHGGQVCMAQLRRTVSARSRRSAFAKSSILGGLA